MHTKFPEIASTPDLANFPVDRALKEYYSLEFSAVDLPDTFRIEGPDDRENVALHPSTKLQKTPEHIKFLQYEFRRQAPQQAYEGSWWIEANGFLRRNGEGIRSVGDIPVIAKHRLYIAVDGKNTGQGYDVIEMGEPEDEATVETAIDTLKLVDQYSGGLMANQRDGMRVTLVKGITLKHPHGKVEAGGFAVNGAVVINTDGIRRWEGVTEENYREVLSAVIVHEVLGHGMERAVMGFSGGHYDEHFSYSDYADDATFNRIAQSVTPKNAEITGTEPVNKYGRVNAAEDNATSVESTVSHAMGWSALVNQVERMKSEVDEHRSDLTLALMERGAKKAKQFEHTPGFVGSEVRYTRNDEGTVTGVEPVRTMKVTHMQGAEAVQDELRRVVEVYTPKDAIIVGSGDWM